MKLGTRLWAGLAILMIVVFAVAACGGQSQPEGEAALSGEALLEARCAGCHGLDQVTGATKTEAAWLSTVERMIEKGATLNAAEKETLVAYLAEMYGP
jgi:mono/diheme cytochrome c family protein